MEIKLLRFRTNVVSYKILVTVGLSTQLSTCFATCTAESTQMMLLLDLYCYRKCLNSEKLVLQKGPYTEGDLEWGWTPAWVGS